LGVIAIMIYYTVYLLFRGERRKGREGRKKTAQEFIDKELNDRMRTVNYKLGLPAGMELFPLTKQTLRNLVTRSISYKSSLNSERKSLKRSGGYYDISQPHLVGFHPSAKGDFPREVDMNNMP